MQQHVRDSMMAQLLVLQARVAYRQTRIQSGFYKTREVYHGTKMLPENRLTEDELLRQEFSTMEAHIHQMQEIQESFLEDE